MRFSWQDFITLGNLFITQVLLLSPQEEELQEAYLRTSISRLYYGIFGLVREALESKGFKAPKDKSIHLYTIETLRKSESEKEREIGLYLDRLRRERNIADYEREFSVNVARAQNCRKYVESILKKL